MSERKPTEAQIKVATRFHAFQSKIADLHEGFPQMQIFSAIALSLSSSEMMEFSEKYGTLKVTKKTDNRRFDIPIGKVTQFKRFRQRTAAAQSNFERIPGFYLTAYTDATELLMAFVAEQLLFAGKANEKVSSKTISFGQILTADKYADIKLAVIAAEIDSFQRSSFMEKISWLNSIESKMAIDHDVIKACVEIFERRNCIVHADGKASKFYVENLNKHGVTSACKIGDNILPDQEYLKGVFSNLSVLGSMLLSVTWTKIFKDQDEGWETILALFHDNIYELMLREEFLAAENISSFISEHLKFLIVNDTNKRLLKINWAICKQRLDSNEEAQRILKSEDWRSSGHRYRAVVHAIQGDEKTAIEEIKRAHASDEINEKDLIEWPAFESLRKTKKFSKIYDELFGAGSAAVALGGIQEKTPRFGEKINKLVKEAIRSLPNRPGKFGNSKKAKATGMNATTGSGPTTHLRKRNAGQRKAPRNSRPVFPSS